MTYSYFPGCTLKNKAVALDKYARLSAQKLGVTMEEIEEWQCCGAVYPLASNEYAQKLSSVRALAYAKEHGNDLLTLCSACHHVIKLVNNDVRTKQEMRDKLNAYMPETPYDGSVNVVHYLEMLRDVVTFDELKKNVVNPFKGKKIGAYYGCLLLRPSKIMAFDDPENPTIMEDFITAIGAKPVLFAMRNECCGGYVVLDNAQTARDRCAQILADAKRSGAEMIITACPLCMYNLRENGGSDIPVYYFTELLAEALGVKEENADG